MTAPRSVLNSYDKETCREKFTRPLRGFLGGRIVTVDTADKGKKIYKVSERVFLGAVLFTIGIPYTLVAGAVLAFSSSKKDTLKPKNQTEPSLPKNPTQHSLPKDPSQHSLPKDPTKSSSSSSSSSEKAPVISKDLFSNDVYTSHTDDELIGLSYLFGDNPHVKWRNAPFINAPYQDPNWDNDFKSLCKINVPTFVIIHRTYEHYSCLIIPIEKQNAHGAWERTLCVVGEQAQFRDEGRSLWIGGMDEKVDLSVFKNPSAQYKPYKKLMTGDPVTIEGSKFRLYVK